MAKNFDIFLKWYFGKVINQLQITRSFTNCTNKTILEFTSFKDKSTLAIVQN